MAINTQTIRIDLNTGRTIPVAFAHQNDTNRQLTFQLYNNGVAFTPSSTTVKFAYKSPIVNGRYSVITGSQMASGTVSGNTVTVTLPAQYTQVSGVGLLTMILTTSGNTLRPVNIKFVCQGSADGDDTVLGASDWPEGLYDYMDNWLEENEPTEIANLKSDLSVDSDIINKNIFGLSIQENLYDGGLDFSGDWTKINVASSALQDEMHLGFPVMKITSTWARFYKVFPVESGKTYTFEAWFNADNTSSVFLYLVAPDTENAATLSTGNRIQYNNQFEANKWNKISVTFTASTAGNISPYIAVSSGTGIKISRLVVVEGASVFDLSEALESRATVTALNEVSAKTDVITTNTNLVDGLGQTESKVYERTTANIVDNEYCNIFPQIAIESGKTYYYRNLYGFFCVIKYANGTAVNLTDDQSVTINGSFTATADGYIYISTRKGKSGFVFTDSEELYNSGLTGSYSTIDVQNIPKIYHVEKDGSGDFDSLVSAIEEATKYMDSVVYLGDGEWDLVDELGNAYIESVSSSQRGVYLKNRVRLVFSSRATVKCDYTGTRSDTITWLSAFNLGAYGATIENGKIRTKNIRYSIHDERDQDDDFYINNYIDCDIEHDNSLVSGASVQGYPQCIGGGLGRSGKINIDGCLFSNPNQLASGTLVSYHNTAGNGKSRIDIARCYLKDNGRFRFTWYGQSTEKTKIFVSNCSMGQPINLGAETETSTNENMELIAWNNEIRA